MELPRFRRIGNALMPLVLSTVVVCQAPADQVIGELLEIGGVPIPFSNSGTFFSPTREIRFHNGPNGEYPNIRGVDQPDSFPCEEHHVVATCRVNGLEVPHSWHGYVNWGGWCKELYSWNGVVVDLGAPGEFTIECRCDDSLGYGTGGMSAFQIFTVGEVPPPFEILYVYPDDQIYQHGETATLRAVTRSNWGSGPVHLWMQLWNFWTGPIWVGPDEFSLSPGQEHETVLTWQTPSWALGNPQYDLSAYLRDPEENLLGSVSNADAFICTGQTDQQIQEMQDDINTCWMNSGVECGFEIASMAPGAVGAMASAGLFVEEMCRAGRLHREGRWAEGWAMILSALKDFGAVTLEVVCPQELGCPDLPRVLHKTDEILSTGSAALTCSNAAFEAAMGTGKSRSVPDGTLVDSLATWFRVGVDSSYVEIADVLFVDGPCAIRVEADSSYADADSSGLYYADVTRVSDSLGVALVVPQVHRYTVVVQT